MVPGFKTRLLQELKYLVATFKEFEEIKPCMEHFAIHETCFPPNCMPWAGASILSSLNSEIEKFEITHKDYNEKYNSESIPDRFGEAFLYGLGSRESPYFNKEFEEFLKNQKSMIFSSTTPYSTRAYTSKREPIANMLQKSLRNMD